MFEHFFTFCRLNAMEETRTPAKRARHSEDQEGTCKRMSATSHLRLFMFISYDLHTSRPHARFFFFL